MMVNGLVVIEDLSLKILVMNMQHACMEFPRLKWLHQLQAFALMDVYMYLYNLYHAGNYILHVHSAYSTTWGSYFSSHFYTVTIPWESQNTFTKKFACSYFHENPSR